MGRMNARLTGRSPKSLIHGMPTESAPIFSSKKFFASSLAPLCTAVLLTGMLGGLALSRAQAQTHGTPSKAELALKNLEVAEGLEVELFASDPLLMNPVAFSIDEKGRFFIAETHRYKDAIFDIWAATQEWKDADASFRTVEERAAFLAKEFAGDPEKLTKHSEIIRLVEDRDGDGRADHQSVFSDGFNEAVAGTGAGVLASRGQLWYTCIPDLWRFSITDAGEAAARERLHTGYGVHIGVSGHDLHGLALGPDGKLYFTIGDRGARVRTQEGHLLDFPDTGAVFRCNPDGSQLEVFAFGLRNPQEIAFDRYGNLWAHDNDTGGADKSRVIHVVQGADYGWRYSYQFMSGFGPWVQESVWEGGIDDVLPHAGYGAQGPSGLAYYPGVGLPARFDNHFFACDFPQGVLTYTIEPSGASYTVVNREKLLWNAGPTDVDFGPNGDLYVSDWGRTYQMTNAGRIYRLFDPKQTGSAEKEALAQLLGEGMADRPISELITHLAHADMRVRTAAQFELVSRVFEANTTKLEILGKLTETAIQAPNQLARIHAIWALNAIGDFSDSVLATFGNLLSDRDPEIRAQAVRAAGNVETDALAEPIAALLDDANARVRFHAARAYGKTAARHSAVRNQVFANRILDFLRANDNTDAYLTHAGMMALLDAGDRAGIERAAADSSAAVRRVALLCLRRLKDPAIARFLADPDQGLRVEAARAINDAPISDAMPALALELEKADCPEAILTRAINANFRLGEPANAIRLTAFATRTDAPETARVEALNALAAWKNPPARDRVVGLWRPLEPRDPSAAREALTAEAENILSQRSAAVSVSLVKAAGKLRAVAIAPRLLHVLQNPDQPVEVRREIPAALALLDPETLPQAMKTALLDSDSSIRRAAVELLDQVEVPNVAGLLEELITTEADYRLAQSALTTLGRIESAEADQAISRLLTGLVSGDLDQKLHLELLEAAEARTAPSVQQQLARYKTSRDEETAWTPTLVGGFADAGKKLFDERDELGCARCHAINKRGGNVGPDLAGIGARHGRQYLLESIIEPNKHFAPGYERVVLELAGGASVAGEVKTETDTELILLTPEEHRVAKADILARHTAPSVMPPGMENLMTKRELRDLIEYLANLR